MARAFYYDVEGKELGPVSGRELLNLRARGAIGADTWVRREDSDTWRPFRSVDLREEERKERAAGPLRLLLRVLLRNRGPKTLVVTLLVLFVLLAMLAMAAVFLWPLLLLLLVWLFIFNVIRMK
ncbi:MAG: DUF4339 domain-containing protein [Akkermansia sp.]|nr:DUF4339 domain-containing protein [Akkermansia sp.]MBR7109648.1 DUF4339 domain-containing protein [Akkermansia sp.]